MSTFSVKDAVDDSKELFSDKDPIMHLNSILEIIAFLLAMIDFFGLQDWIELDVSKISVHQQFGSLSGVCFVFLCIFVLLQAISVIHLYPKLDTASDVFETVTWVLVIGKFVYDFANRPGVSISCNTNFGVYVITIGWFVVRKIASQYRWNKWEIDSMSAESRYYDIHGNIIYEGDIVKYNGCLYLIEKHDSNSSDVPVFQLSKVNFKKNEHRIIDDNKDDYLSLTDVISREKYDLEILKKANWNRAE